MEVKRFIALIILKTAFTQEFLQHGKVCFSYLIRKGGELSLTQGGIKELR